MKSHRLQATARLNGNFAHQPSLQENLKDLYRNRLGRYDRINDIVCRVVNQTILMKRAGTL